MWIVIISGSYSPTVLHYEEYKDAKDKYDALTGIGSPCYLAECKETNI